MAIVVEDVVSVIRPEPKAEEKQEKPNGKPAVDAAASDEADTEVNSGADEDENGLTQAERAELTAKMQKAVGKKHRALRQAEEFAAAQYNERNLAQRRVGELEREIADLQEQIKTAKPVDPDADKPKRENFASDEAYSDAVIDYRVKKQLEKDRLDALKKVTQEKQEAVIKAAEERVTKARSLVPDWEETVGEADIMVPPAVAGYMQESELIAELSYHFAKHPDVLERVSKLTPARQLVEIGKIESKLQPFGPAEGKTNAEPKEDNGDMPSQDDESASSTETRIRASETRAPVIKPITSGSGSQVETPEGKKNVREVIQDWEKRNRRSLHQRKRH